MQKETKMAKDEASKEAQGAAAKIEWLQTLGWGEDQLEDLRVTGYAYIRQGKYSIALPLFEALNVLDPTNAYDAQTMGALLVQVGNPAKALRYLDKALKLQPKHGPTLVNLAKAFLMLGNKKEGLKLARIIKKERKREPAIRSLAEALLLAFG